MADQTFALFANCSNVAIFAAMLLSLVRITSTLAYEALFKQSNQSETHILLYKAEHFLCEETLAEIVHFVPAIVVSQGWYPSSPSETTATMMQTLLGRLEASPVITSNASSDEYKKTQCTCPVWVGTIITAFSHRYSTGAEHRTAQGRLSRNDTQNRSG